MATIAEELQNLAANKAAIKTAISSKNPTIPPTDDLSQWPTSIGSIQDAATVISGILSTQF